MGVSVCLASGKDGVGKSTIVANLGLALTKNGVSTIVVDGDIEGASIGLLFGVDPNTPSIHDCLSGEMSCEEVIIEKFGLKAIVGGIRIEQLVNISLDTFPKIIKEISEKYSIVLVDSPAGLGTDTVTVLESCQSVLLVLTPDINSLTNTLKTLAVAKKVGATILGAVVNRTSGRFTIPSDKIEDLLKVKVLVEIGEDEKVQKSLHQGVPIFNEDPNCEFSLKIKEIANQLIGG